MLNELIVGKKYCLYEKSLSVSIHINKDSKFTTLQCFLFFLFEGSLFFCLLSIDLLFRPLNAILLHQVLKYCDSSKILDRHSLLLISR